MEFSCYIVTVFGEEYGPSYSGLRAIMTPCPTWVVLPQRMTGIGEDMTWLLGVSCSVGVV